MMELFNSFSLITNILTGTLFEFFKKKLVGHYLGCSFFGAVKLLKLAL
jgi:hypothetical protein